MIRNPVGHVATRLLREIEALVRIGDGDREKPILVIEELRSTDWASLTFVGQCHTLNLRLDGEQDVTAAALVRLADGLADHDIVIARHFVADISVTTGVARRGPLTLGRKIYCQPIVIEALVLLD